MRSISGYISGNLLSYSNGESNMIPRFNFIQPKNLNDTLVLLGKHQGNARLIAGGTDIVPGFQQEASRFKNEDGIDKK